MLITPKQVVRRTGHGDEFLAKAKRDPLRQPICKQQPLLLRHFSRGGAACKNRAADFTEKASSLVERGRRSCRDQRCGIDARVQ